MVDFIEGKHPVVEALRTGVPIKRLLMADNLQRDSLVEDVLRKARNLGVEVQNVPKKKLDELSERGSHQGVMAETKPFAYSSAHDILTSAGKYAESNDGRALIVVLDHITDAGNMGAVIRSAECVGASGVVIPNKRSAVVTPATYKSSAGAVSHIPVAQVPNLVQFLQHAKEAGFWVATASEHNKAPIWKTNLKGKIVLVMGSEEEGISRIVLEAGDFSVTLPQYGSVESLNVAQAATACMYEWLRQNTSGC